jgi:hypothetical protein
MTDDRWPLRELAHHVLDVISHLPDGLVSEDLRVLVGLFHGVGIIGPSGRQSGIAGLLEDRPPAVPAVRKQPEPVDEHDRCES